MKKQEIVVLSKKGGKHVFEKIKSEGIAHLSYILGDGMEAVVIDPAGIAGSMLTSLPGME